jgi:TetR/AcrR family transcriptional regulator
MTSLPGLVVSRPRRGGAQTREAILQAAIAEFAEHGYSGARVERIVERANTNMRLVYVHFGSKEELYGAALEAVYAEIRGKERDLNLADLTPRLAMEKLIDFTVDHFLNHPAFRSLTTYENLAGGQTVGKSQTIAVLSSPLIETIRGVLDRGQRENVFHRSVDPLQLYVSIVALSSHHLNNVHTLSATFQTDLSAPKWRAERAKHVRAMLLAYLTGGAE